MSEPWLTIFSAPKPFTDPHIATIQRNAIRSWRALGSAVEVLLLGEEDGLAETAAALGVRHLSQVERSDWGTPLIRSLFALAHAHGRGQVLTYVNADILLFPDFLEAVEQVRRQQHDFLIVGRRWDLDVTEPLEPAPGWAAAVQARARRKGFLQSPTAIDFFTFPAHLYRDVPPFSVGRAGWDNWMIAHARRQGWPVVDVTPAVTVVHQNHDYRHLPGGRSHHDHPETARNVQLAGGEAALGLILDADYELRAGRVRRARLTLPRLLRRLERALTPADGRHDYRWRLARRVRRLWKRLTVPEAG